MGRGQRLTVDESGLFHGCGGSGESGMGIRFGALPSGDKRKGLTVVVVVKRRPACSSRTRRRHTVPYWLEAHARRVAGLHYSKESVVSNGVTTGTIVSHFWGNGKNGEKGGLLNGCRRLNEQRVRPNRDRGETPDAPFGLFGGAAEAYAGP